MVTFTVTPSQYGNDQQCTARENSTSLFHVDLFGPAGRLALTKRQ
jgi:hypothetical protein